MRNWQQFVRRNLGGLRVTPEREAAIVTELAVQMEQTYVNAVTRGLSEEAACAEAEAQFPDWEQLAREINTAVPNAPPRVPEAEHVTGGLWFGFTRDLRFAARQLARSPSFSVIAVATLGFAIGGCTAVFSVADALTLRGLPYKDPATLVSIETRKADQPEIEPWTSALDFFDTRRQTRTLSQMASISPIWNMVLTGRGPARRLQTLFVSASFFPMLGARAERGRFFSADEDRGTTASSVVVISHALWQERMNSDPNAIGQQIALDGGAYSVIGIAPASFRYLGEPVLGTVSDIDAWLPMAANPLVTSNRALRYLKVIGRLAPTATIATSRAELAHLSEDLARQFPDTDRGFSIGVASLQERVAGQSRVTLSLLATTVVFILLMACANVASLVLARALSREREIAARVALGATPWRLIRLVLAESLLVAVLGCATGTAAAWAGVRAFVNAAPEAMIHNYAPAIDTRALVVSLAAALFCAAAASLPPALRLSRADIEPALRASGRGLASGHNRLQSILVVTQIATALVLLSGAGLLVRSFMRLLEIDPGFDGSHVVAISTQMPATAQQPAQRAAIYEQIRTQLLALPGVAAVGAVSRLPMMGRNLGSWIFIEGKSHPGDPKVDIEYRVATASYFSAMDIKLRAGRVFDISDDADPGTPVIINETAARRFWPGESAIGRHVKLGPNPEREAWHTVVGVVGDLRHVGLDVAVLPEVYRPYAVNPLGAPILTVRTAGDPAPMVQTLVSRVQSISSEIPAYDIYIMRDLVARSTAQRRFVMSILAGFALAALVLAGVGIFGVMSRVVAGRTPELGVRMALGATPGVAAQLIAGQGARLAAAGVVIGLAGSVAMTRFLGTLLFEVKPLDPAAFAAAIAVLVFCIALACFVPVWRATRVDPLVALRRED